MERLEFARHLRRSQTPAEQRLWAVLRGGSLGCKFRRQVPYREYFLDFVCFERRVVVEVDGRHHDDRQADAVRDAALQADGFRVLRFGNDDVVRRLEGVRDVILAAVAVAPSPSRIP